MFLLPSDKCVYFNDHDAAVQFCEKNGIKRAWFAPKLLYSGVAVSEPEVCELVGYIDDGRTPVAVISVSGNTIKVLPQYLAEMQPTKKMMLGFVGITDMDE